MRLTRDVEIGDILKRTKSGEIQWGENARGEYTAIINGAEFTMREGATWPAGMLVFITKVKAGEKSEIVEPPAPFFPRESPMGRGLRRICRFFGWKEFPGEPETAEDREREQLRLAMRYLFREVSRQRGITEY